MDLTFIVVIYLVNTSQPCVVIILVFCGPKFIMLLWSNIQLVYGEGGEREFHICILHLDTSLTHTCNTAMKFVLHSTCGPLFLLRLVKCPVRGPP